jgi:hypothetical protein
MDSVESWLAVDAEEMNGSGGWVRRGTGGGGVLLLPP